MRRAILVLFLLLSPAWAKAQSDPAPATSTRVQPFTFDALTFAKTDAFGYSSRLDLFVQVPFDNITFIKKENSFVGGYAITARVLDADEKLIKEKSWTRTLKQPSFDATKDAGAYDLSQDTLALDPGPYVVEVTFEDQESRKAWRLSRHISVRTFDRNAPALSDIMLVSRVHERNGRRSITPQIDANVADLTRGFSLFYEFYNPYDVTALRIHYRILRQGERITAQSQIQPVKKGPNSFITHVPTSELGFGAYQAEVLLTQPEDSLGEHPLARGMRPFTIEWSTGLATVAITNLDEAIDQMRYFASSDDIDTIRAATTDAEKRRRFEAFWERHNPTPGSPMNRAMVEYYKRVEYANVHFKHYVAGWKSDRGMVYIIYGPPSYIDRHPFEVDTKPYEVWEYYDVNKRFLFMDESGFGDYRLLYPIWDDRNRLR